MRDLLTVIEVEPSALSQQLAVLRRSGIVTAAREGSTVVYELAGGDVADLMGGRAPDPHRNAGRCRPTTAPTEPDGSAACPGMGSVRTRSCVDRQLREVVSLTQGSANRSISTKAK